MKPDFNDVWAVADQTPGFFALQDAQALYAACDLAVNKSKAPFLEVGSFKGRSTRILGSWERTVFMIEPSHLWSEPTGQSWDGTSSCGFRYDAMKVDKGSRAALIANTSDMPCVLIPGRTCETSFGTLTFALIHIDGNHTPGGVDVDCEHLLWRLEPGGVVAFHDYGVHDYPFVTEMVDQWCGDWKELARGESLIVKVKP